MGEEKKEGRSWWERLLVPFGFAAGAPTNPHQVPLLEGTPEGLVLVYQAMHPAEAELVRQMLLEAGFRVEFVPSAMTGIFGTTGSPLVFVHREDEAEAIEFLEENWGEGGEEESDRTD